MTIACTNLSVLPIILFTNGFASYNVKTILTICFDNFQLQPAFELEIDDAMIVMIIFNFVREYSSK